MGFELTAVYVANIFGIMLICILLISNLGRLREKNDETYCLLLMMFFTFLGCAIDPIASYADGQPGSLNRILVHVGNSLLYMVDMFGTFFWLAFLLSHLKIKLSLTHRYTLHCALMLGVAVILVNFFLPIVFEISDTNSYSRSAGYWFFCFIDYGFMIDSIVLYLICRHRGGSMKSFPIAVYLLPLLAGNIAQSVFYGISVISASFTISIAGLMASLQSERIYRDKLTGIYNFAYLDRLEKQYSKKAKHKVSGIMINLNGFKKINREQGRAAANNALRDAAQIIDRAIGELGIVARYSGDEFIAIVNTQDEMAINMNIASIQSRFTEFNRESKNPYKLSACFCSCSIDPQKSLSEFLDEITKRMLEEKSEFYSQGENNRRRR